MRFYVSFVMFDRFTSRSKPKFTLKTKNIFFFTGAAQPFTAELSKDRRTIKWLQSQNGIFSRKLKQQQKEKREGDKTEFENLLVCY